MSKFKVGDVVEVTNPDENYYYTKGRVFVIGDCYGSMYSNKERDDIDYKESELSLFGSRSLKLNVDKIIFSGKTCVVYNKKGKGVAQCGADDNFDPVVGFAMAYTLAMLADKGKSAFKDTIHAEYKKQMEAQYGKH